MSQEQIEAKLVEQTTSIVETVKKINEALKDTRISELCGKLDAYAKALDAVINKKHYMFKVHFSIVGYAYAGTEYAIRLYVDNEHIYTVYVPLGTTIDAMFEKIFTSQEIKSSVVSKIHDTLADLASEIAGKANLVERIKSIEERLEEEDP
jgi:N-glycosylase/DNA lyase